MDNLHDGIDMVQPEMNYEMIIDILNETVINNIVDKNLTKGKIVLKM